VSEESTSSRKSKAVNASTNGEKGEMGGKSGSKKRKKDEAGKTEVAEKVHDKDSGASTSLSVYLTAS
jgi:hypothetical protein